MAAESHKDNKESGMEEYSREAIREKIKTRWAGSEVFFAKEIDSTNLWARRLAREGAAHGTLCVAEFQTAGRGSRGRRYFSVHSDGEGTIAVKI